jgi:hypothetical protein
MRKKYLFYGARVLNQIKERKKEREIEREITQNNKIFENKQTNILS